MKFALHFANLAFPDGPGAKRFAQAAEKAGFECIVAIEHVVVPTHYDSKYPYSADGKMMGKPNIAMPDPLTWMTYAAAVTEKIKFMTGVLILPQRNAVVLAKQAATMDHMSGGGRIMLGIGVGWLEEEFEALGIPFRTRGKYTDEAMEAMRVLWAEDDASYDGELINFRGINCNPKPPGGSVPFVIGGHSKFAARRAGRYGDGYFPATGMQTDFQPVVELAREEAAKAGRDPNALEISAGCPDALPGSGKDPLEAIAIRKQMGVDRVVLPTTPFLAGSLEENLARFGEDVIAKAKSL
jgi:probable F420-dependent oxidoreductase